MVETDHKPLESIFKKPLYKAPRRLKRILLRLFDFDFNLVWKPGKQMYIADHLSRAHLKLKPINNELKIIQEVMSINDEKDLAMSKEKIIEYTNATNNDPELQTVK